MLDLIDHTRYRAYPGNNLNWLAELNTYQIFFVWKNKYRKIMSFEIKLKFICKWRGNWKQFLFQKLNEWINFRRVSSDGKHVGLRKRILFTFKYKFIWIFADPDIRAPRRHSNVDALIAFVHEIEVISNLFHIEKKLQKPKVT